MFSHLEVSVDMPTQVVGWSHNQIRAAERLLTAVMLDLKSALERPEGGA